MGGAGNGFQHEDAEDAKATKKLKKRREWLGFEKMLSGTGVILTSDGLTSLGRHFKRGMRAKIKSLENLGPAERQSLAGLLAYCRSIEPDFINRLILKYGNQRVGLAMLPPDGEPKNPA